MGAVVWQQSYDPFGRVVAGRGSDARFAGQWFASENGLHQNWMRDYDATLGRYIQADPLGLVDGASVYGYALGNPARWSDPRGESVYPQTMPKLPTPPSGKSGPLQCVNFDENPCTLKWEEERANCYRKMASYEISDLAGCLRRANERLKLCTGNRPEAEWPEEWSDADEDVPKAPPVKRLPPPILRPVPLFSPGFGAPGFLRGIGGGGFVFR